MDFIIPEIPQAKIGHQLVVILTTLPEAALDKLKALIASAERWDDDVVLVPCLSGTRQQELEQQKQDGSIAQIYRLAREAFDLDWKHVMVVDALTREQLTGNLRTGRSPEVSVVLLQKAKNEKLEGQSETLLGVLAKRMVPEEAIKVMRAGSLVSCDRPNDDRAERNINSEHYHDRGILLYDPTKQLYDQRRPSSSPSEVIEWSAVDRVLELRPSLPPEIALQIRRYSDGDIELSELTTAPTKFSDNRLRLEIHALVVMKSEEIEDLQTRLNETLSRNEGDDLKKVQCVVHPWKGHKPATRRDFWRLFQRYYESNREPYYSLFLFVGWYGWHKEDTEVGLIQWNYDRPPPTRRQPVETVANLWVQNVDGYTQVSTISRNYDDPEFELVLDPQKRFFHDPPPFVRLDANTVMVAPVFLLTKNLTQEQRRTIEAELDAPGEFDDSFSDGKGYAYVEWEQDEDGKEEDMWRLLWQVASYRGSGSTLCALFIDQDSPNDKMVIVANTRYMGGEGEYSKFEAEEDYVFGPYTGMLWGRCAGRAAMNVWCNLDISNMSFDELFDGLEHEYHTWERPGVVWKNSIDDLSVEEESSGSSNDGNDFGEDGDHGSPAENCVST